jgi:hypothetical protein
MRTTLTKAIWKLAAYVSSSTFRSSPFGTGPMLLTTPSMPP